MYGARGRSFVCVNRRRLQIRLVTHFGKRWACTALCCYTNGLISKEIEKSLSLWEKGMEDLQLYGGLCRSMKDTSTKLEDGSVKLKQVIQVQVLMQPLHIVGGTTSDQARICAETSSRARGTP